MLSSCEYDIIVFTETWLRTDIGSHEISPAYAIFRCDRSELTSNHSRGGGVYLPPNSSTELYSAHRHIAALFSIPVLKRESASALSELVDQFDRHVNVLNHLEEAEEHWNSVLVEGLSRRLDSVTLKEWEKQCKEDERPTYEQNSHALETDPPTTSGSQPKQHNCDICGASYKTRSGLYTHKKIHTSTSVETNPFKCDQCSSRFVRKSSLNVHKKKHLPLMQQESSHRNKPDKSQFKCEFCSRTFVSNYTLKNHRIVKHTTEKNFKCDICGREFHMMKQLMMHLQWHSAERSYKCDICGKGYKLKQHLVAHMKMHITTQSFECDICGQICKASYTLQVHKIIKHTSEKKFACNVCGKDFHTKSLLTRHLKWHSSERPYRCPVCGKDFLVRNELARHLPIHSDERPYECDLCDASFKVPGNLKIHRKIHKPADRKLHDLKHACDICDRKFATNYALTCHLRTHTGERLFECDVCHKTFFTCVLQYYITTGTSDSADWLCIGECSFTVISSNI
ncbi:zinc finger protein 62-like [Sabethes cyaneus]|uniref:zinc finger protein 62-like n=1 Tax=Sabethes cyaneus TaxID=53552 RepID=UPI00237E48D0|nr:zinc finger protein 62-like [Sabethes cyaneus]